MECSRPPAGNRAMAWLSAIRPWRAPGSRVRTRLRRDRRGPWHKKGRSRPRAPELCWPGDKRRYAARPRRRDTRERRPPPARDGALLPTTNPRRRRPRAGNASRQRGHRAAARRTACGSLQVGQQFVRRRVALPPVLRQQFENDAVEVRGRLRIQHATAAADPGSTDRARIEVRLFAGEWRLAGQALVKDRAQRKQVRARIQHFAGGLFGRHVKRCPGEAFERLGGGFRLSGHAEAPARARCRSRAL